MSPVLLVAPASEPVSLAEAKAWLRLDTSDEDATVSALITAARSAIEATTRRLLVTQTWRLSFDAWPQCRVASPLGGGASLQAPAVTIPLAPVTSVTALRVYDPGGVPQTIASGTYQLRGAPDEARIVFTTAPPAPGRAAAGVEIDVVAGYGVPSDVPQPLRQAMLMLIAAWFENRGDAEATDATRLPSAVAALIAPFCRLRLA